jgi:hypothetical protein
MLVLFRQPSVSDHSDSRRCTSKGGDCADGGPNYFRCAHEQIRFFRCGIHVPTLAVR